MNNDTIVTLVLGAPATIIALAIVVTSLFKLKFVSINTFEETQQKVQDNFKRIDKQIVDLTTMSSKQEVTQKNLHKDIEELHEDIKTFRQAANGLYKSLSDTNAGLANMMGKLDVLMSKKKL